METTSLLSQLDLLQTYRTTLTHLCSLQYQFFQDYLHVAPWTFVVAYLLMVFLLPKVLIALRGGGGQNKDNRVASGSKSSSSSSSSTTATIAPTKFGLLRYTMASWNLFLSVLSMFMLLGFGIPYLKQVFGDVATTGNTHYRGLSGSLCDTTGNQLFEPSPMMFWANIFVLSKYIELLDTVFLIVKNPERPVPFLHFYHHATVLAFSWYADTYRYTAALWSILINSSVHCIMYFYYFLTELGYRPSWAVVITVVQITQMIVGVAMNGYWIYAHLTTEGGCACDAPNAIMTAAIVMYGSYLLLFVKFFIKRYSKKPVAAAAQRPKQL